MVEVHRGSSRPGGKDRDDHLLSAVRSFGLNLFLDDGPHSAVAKWKVEQGPTGDTGRGCGLHGDDGRRYGKHVGGGDPRVAGDNRADKKTTTGSGEVDADGARPISLGDVLGGDGILAWRPQDPLEPGGPGTRGQGFGIDNLEGDFPGDLRGQSRGQQTDDVWGELDRKAIDEPQGPAVAQASRAC